MGRIRRQTRTRGAGFLCTAFFVSAVAVAAPYSFDDSGYLGPAELMPSWRETLARQDAESHVLAGCLAGEACPRAYEGLRYLLTKAADLPESRQIHLVNHYVNRKRYRNDRSLEVVTAPGADPVKFRSRWATVDEFVVRGGDCEDYATTKYFLLRQLGVPSERMRVAVVYDRAARGYHAVLALRRATDGVVLLLDSDGVFRTGLRHSYRFVYSMNETAIWDNDAKRVGSPVAATDKETPS
jgi:predicted transglutaminase-like cysteine proteinase